MFEIRFPRVSTEERPIVYSEEIGAEYINSIHPDYSVDDNVEKTKNLTKEEVDDVVSGNYKKDKVVAYGITHYKYEDCKKEDLVDIGGIKVHRKRAEAFEEMKKAAVKEGVNIRIVSGFRSTQYQKTVFKKKFGVQNSPTDKEFEARLRFSAPSGFSEHHTGLAIDINSTEQSFANTKEYKWLQEHASEYGFEMSFPENGKQGLGFEPWHWRYIGKEEDESAGVYREIFKAAREGK